MAGRRSVPPGGTVSVPVRLEMGERVGSMNFSLIYNASVLQLDRVVVGDQVRGRALFRANTQVLGIIRFGVAVSSGQEVTGGGPMAHLEFTAVGAEGSSSALSLGDPFVTDVATTRLSIGLQNGLVTIEPRPLGDSTGNGCLGTKDALAALQMSVGERLENLNLDMDQDGSVTAEDARLMVGLLLQGGPRAHAPQLA